MEDAKEIEITPYSSQALYQTEYDAKEYDIDESINSRKQAMLDHGEAAEQREVCVCRKIGLSRAMLHLTHQQRKVIVLKYRHDYNQAKIAHHLGITARSAQICLENARKVLLENSGKHELREYL